MAQEIQSIPLSSIQGLHRFVRDVMDTLQLPALRYPDGHTIQERELIEIIHVVPLRLVKTNQNQFVCTGNIALFQAASRTLHPESAVACVIESTVDEQNVQRRVLTEIFVGRPVLGFHQSDVPAYYVAFCKAIQSGLIPEPGKGAVSHIADLFGVDPRRLNSISIATEGSEASKLAKPESPKQFGAVKTMPDTSTEELFATDAASSSAIFAENVLPNAPLPQKIAISELQKKTRKRPISGVTLDRNGRSVGLFVPLAAEPTRAQIDAYRERVKETEESLLFIDNVFLSEILDLVPLRSYDV